MALTEAEFQEHQRAQREKATRARRVERDTSAALSHLVQAEVPIKQLTGSEHWDYFLSLLQAKSEKAKQEVLNIHSEGLASPREMDYETLAERHARAITWQARLETLEEIIAIPSNILAGAQAQRDDGEEG